MRPLGQDYEPTKCDQCGIDIDEDEKRYECNCGAMLCHVCYGICQECDQ